MIITVQNVNPTKLHDELIKAGYPPLIVENDRPENQEGAASNTWLTYPGNADEVAIQAVIAAHDPTPLPQIPTTEERLQIAEDTILGLMDIIMNGGM